MTTAQHDHVVVEANGLVRLCSWCVPFARRVELHRQHRCTDSLCPSCKERLEQEAA